MAEQSEKRTALAGLRVLELADEKGIYCGKLMADLGAEVIKIERPGGDATRGMGPFLHDEPHPERSLYFLLYNTNKKGITLNIECADGQDIFKRLVMSADIVVETFPPGFLAGLGLDYAALSELNPRLVMTSITPFGQTGSYRDYHASDITAGAMGGTLYVSGEADAPPVRGAGFLSYHQASSIAAMGTMVALWCRNTRGFGQHVDVSMQEAIAAQLDRHSILYFAQGTISTRIGSAMPYTNPGRLFPCKDGYVDLLVPQRHQWQSLVDWMGNETLADPKFLDDNVRLQHRALIDREVEAWTVNYTKDELFREGQRRNIPTGPSRNVDEVVEDVQLNARDFFVEVDHPETGPLRYPGAPYIFHATPWGIRHSAPRIGEHNGDIYGDELGLSNSEQGILRAAGVI